MFLKIKLIVYLLIFLLSLIKLLAAHNLDSLANSYQKNSLTLFSTPLLSQSIYEESSNALTLEFLELENLDFVALPIPDEQANQSIFFSLPVVLKDKSKIPKILLRSNLLLPEILGMNGQALNLQRQQHQTNEREQSDCLGTVSESYLLFPPVGLKLFKQNRKLYFEAYHPFGSWISEAVEPGDYKLRFTQIVIRNRDISLGGCFSEDDQSQKFQTGRIERAASKYLRVRLLEVATGSSGNPAIEVDGAQFEALAPIPNIVALQGESLSESLIQFNFRIKNTSSHSIRFNTFNSLSINLIQENGELLEPYNLGGSVAVSKESDFPLVMPGKSVAFHLEGRLSRKGNTFYLECFDHSSNFWSFALKPGKYRIQLVYKDLDEDSFVFQNGERKILKNFWTGLVVLPSTEVTLAQ